MSDHRRPPAYRAYIVRIWPSESELHALDAWRAQLVDVRTGESQAFRDPIKLAAFLYAKELVEREEQTIGREDEQQGGTI